MCAGHIDKNMRYRYVNRHYQDIYGIPQDEIAGMRVKDVVGEANFETAAPVLARALAGEEVTHDSSWFVPDRGELFLRRLYTPDFAEDGSVAGAYVLVHELTSDERRSATGD